MSGKRAFWQFHLSSIIVLIVMFAAWLSLNAVVQPVESSVPTFGIGFPALFYYRSENPRTPHGPYELGQPTLNEMLHLPGRKAFAAGWLCLDLLCAAVAFSTVAGVCEYLNARRH